jgi:hypothetical protein
VASLAFTHVSFALMTYDDDLDATTAAYHEAGHAFMAHRLGGNVREVSIEPDEDGVEGRTTVRWPKAASMELRRQSALVAIAGPMAELHFRGELEQLDTLSAWRADWRQVQSALDGERDPQRQLQRWLLEVRATLTDPDEWERLCRIADALAAHGTLDADLLSELLPEAEDADPAPDADADDGMHGDPDDD